MPKGIGYKVKVKDDEAPRMSANMPGVSSESPRKAMMKKRGKRKKKNAQKAS